MLRRYKGWPVTRAGNGLSLNHGLLLYCSIHYSATPSPAKAARAGDPVEDRILPQVPQ